MRQLATLRSRSGDNQSEIAMREARLIVPNNGTTHWQVIEDVRALLLAQFGGYTETQGTGGWVGKTYTATEPLIIFYVAMAPSAEHADATSPGSSRVSFCRLSCGSRTGTM